MLKKIAAAAALAIVASTAVAADGPGFYIGADVGSTKVDLNDFDDFDFDDNDTGYGVFAGYQINQSFAIEANYRRLSDFDASFSGANVNLKTEQMGLSAIAGLPLSTNLSLYGRLGYNRIDLKASGPLGVREDDESGVLYGAGLSYAFSPAVSARLEVQRPASDLTNISAGLAFKF